MSTTQELRKPQFVKVKDLEKARSGYNVYVKVVSAEVKDIETKSGQKIKMIDAVVGDETAVAKAFFKGDNAVHIEKGKVIAIRNGVKKFIKNFISLELDIFGRVTQEKVDIAVDQAYNISEQEHKLPERPRGGNRNFSQGRRDNNRGRDNRRGGRFNNNNDRFNNDRPPRRENDDKRGPRPQRDTNRGQYRNNDNRQTRNNDNREYRNNDNREYRNNDRNNETRQYRNNDNRQGGRTNERRDDRRGDRDNNRPPRRQYDRDFDRRRENERPPRRQQQQRYQPRRQEFRERQPIQWTKIDQISPADDRLNIIAKVISEELVQGKRAMLRCTIGDQTGVVRAFFNQTSALRVGKTVAIFDCEARVVKQHIEIQSRNGRIDAARKQIDRVNEKFNLSDKSWVPAD